ncbi:hypothetical protein KL921_005382 [Ogataea angusta]|nr:hypothetical protein KL921_005382 [Ogataea angusta]KAG7818627.1 hypothetical protein KL909_005017 [Ogataea angusta]KAG7830608.1 hypothetical protein KL920_001199 [Ogataea angusta]KAG7834826.1 hypothetical protein KL943_002141 [Ogataea angusta]KAG7855662.1 hypothetical protein KL939_004126 [Ogataea angusta]
MYVERLDGEVAVGVVHKPCKHVVEAHDSTKHTDVASCLERSDRGDELADGEEKNEEPDQKHQEGQTVGGPPRAGKQSKREYCPRQEVECDGLVVFFGGGIAGSNATNVHEQERVGAPETSKHEESAAGPGVADDETEHTNNDLDESCSGEERA